MNFFYVLMIAAAVLAIKISSEDKAKENKQFFLRMNTLLELNLASKKMLVMNEKILPVNLMMAYHMKTLHIL